MDSYKIVRSQHIKKTNILFLVMKCTINYMRACGIRSDGIATCYVGREPSALECSHIERQAFSPVTVIAVHSRNALLLYVVSCMPRHFILLGQNGLIEHARSGITLNTRICWKLTEELYLYLLFCRTNMEQETLIYS